MPENIQENDSYRFRIFQEVQTTYAIPFLNYPFRVGQSKNRIALDLGSNIGGFPIVFSKNFAKVICVEPSSSANKIALANYIANRTLLPKTIDRAVSYSDHMSLELRRVYIDEEYESKDFTTTIWDEEEIANSEYKGKKREVEEVVTSISLNSILDSIGKPVDFLKCDVEGAEFDALFGQDLSRIGFLVLELHYSALGRNRTQQLISYLEDFFDYYHPQDKLSFSQWPPSPILRMINKTNSNQLLRISGKILSTRVIFRLIKVQNLFPRRS